ncbi:MAG: bifunctional metallophosphatase/5'-nucleotidase [Clostridia bacterium]|nr:bifunctional metallophosphatase/5'-nucleotidase [Clostridia bacterium]
MRKLIALVLLLCFLLTGCGLVDRVKEFFGPTNDIGGMGGPSAGGENDSSDTGDNGDQSGSTDTDEDCTSHRDVDDNGLCDVCSESVIVIVDVYAINDLHGKIVKSDSQPGISGLTTYLKNVSDDNTVLLSTGDMWQGTSESNLTHGALLTDWMSELGFVSMTLGNHEYDWGDEYIYSNLENTDFPFLAINVYERDTNERADYATPSVIVSRGGIEIGIIGAIGDCYSSISGEVVGGFYFKVGDELTELVKAEADRLRSLGVEFIVYSIHDGYGQSSSGKKAVSDSALSSYYDIELSDGYVDLVFEAHTHQSYVLYDTKGVYHIQGGGENSGLSHAKLKYNTANENRNVLSPEVVRSGVYTNLSADPLVDELLSRYADEIAPAYRVVGNNPSYMSSTAIKQLVAKLYYEAGVEKWGEEYDIVLGGGFISARSPYNLYAGTVTYSDLYSILPFDNQIVLCSISGRDLYSKFLTTSNKNYYIYGDDLTYLENNIDLDARYYVVTDTYSSTYVYNRLTEVARYDVNVYARDLVAMYFERRENE